VLHGLVKTGQRGRPLRRVGGDIGVRGNGLVEFAVRGFDGGAPDTLSGAVACGRIPDEQAAIGAAELAAHVRDLLEAVDVLGLHEAQIVTQGRHAVDREDADDERHHAHADRRDDGFREQAAVAEVGSHRVP
jgi:hypothetical protein